MKTLSMEKLNSIDGGGKVCDFIIGASIGFAFLGLFSVVIPTPISAGVLIATIVCLS